MSLSVSQPLHTAEEAEAALACIEQWPPCDERDDRLIEIAALRLERVWRQFGQAEISEPFGRSVVLVHDSKRMFAVKANMDRPSRPRQVEDLAHDRLINWHKEVLYALFTCDYVMGSVANADLFRAAMVNRFSEDGTRDSMPHEYTYVNLGSIANPLIKHLATPAHRARCAAAELASNTRFVEAATPRRRI